MSINLPYKNKTKNKKLKKLLDINIYSLNFNIAGIINMSLLKSTSIIVVGFSVLI